MPCGGQAHMAWQAHVRGAQRQERPPSSERPPMRLHSDGSAVLAAVPRLGGVFAQRSDLLPQETERFVLDHSTTAKRR